MMAQIYRRNLLFLPPPLAFSHIPPTAATPSLPPPFRPDFRKREREREKRTIFFRQINPANWGLQMIPP